MHDRWRSVVLKKRDAKKRVAFSDFVTFIKSEAKKSNDPTYGNISVNESRQSNYKPQKKVVLSTDIINDTSKPTDLNVKCVYCENSSHLLSDCKKFIGISLQERVKDCVMDA